MSLNEYDSDDRDLPQDIDLVENPDDEATVNCPSCGKQIYEDAVLCPYCGQWISTHSPATARSFGWFWPVMIAILIAVILVMWHGLRL